MNRFARLFSSLLCLSLCLGMTACGEKAAPAVSGTDSSNSISSVEASSRDELTALVLEGYRENLIEKNISFTEESGNQELETQIRNYMKIIYPDWEVSAVVYKSGGYLPALSSQEVIQDEWSVSLEGQEDALDVMVVYVKEGGNNTITAIYDDTNAPFPSWDGFSLYAYVKEDPRFFDLPNLPEEVLPENMQAFNLSRLLPEYEERWSLCQVFAYDDHCALLLYYRNADLPEDRYLTGMDAVLLNLDTQEKEWKRNLLPEERIEYGVRLEYGDFTFSFVDDKLRVCRTVGENQDILSLSRDGTLKREMTTPAGQTYSDDGAYYSYTDPKTNNLYLVNAESGEDVLLMEGIASGILENTAGAFIGIEEGKAVYGMYGYEWTIGYGIYDLETGVNTVRDNGQRVMGVSDGKIHLSTGMEPVTYHYVDLSDPEYKEREIPALTKLLEADGYWSRNLQVLPGRNQVALHEQDSEQNETLWIFDLETGEEVRKESMKLYYTSIYSVGAVTDHTVFFYTGQRAIFPHQLLIMNDQA